MTRASHAPTAATPEAGTASASLATSARCEAAEPEQDVAHTDRWLSFLAGHGLHPKLTVSNPGDPDEREADAVAERVLAMTAPTGATLPIGGARITGNALARACCEECEGDDDEGRLSRKAAAAAPVARAAASAAATAVNQGGVPLGAAERAYFEPRFGRDLSQVRIHTGSTAARAASGIGARAYTRGQDIAFAAGQYRPHALEGRRLLAHELAHVVQQEASERPGVKRQVVGEGLDLKLDTCITFPAPVGEVCGQALAEACKKMPFIPACGLICKAFDCSKPAAPTTICPPGWRVATSTGFAGQCCKGGIDNAENCCPPDRISWMQDRCCPPGEVVVDNKCAKPSTVPTSLCLPGQSTLTGQCCIRPMVPQGLICAAPSPGPSKPPPGPLPTIPQLGVLWTDEIHFRQNHPSDGEKDPASVLTPAGMEELDAVLLWLKLSPDLDVRLTGRASSEGKPPYNQELAARRTRFVGAALAAKGFSARISDPLADDGGGSGCKHLDAGQWSCGEERSDPAAARPEDRVVRVTFARNRLPSLPQLTPPPLKPRTP